MIGFEEKALCRKIARMFEIAGEKGYRVDDFSETWLKSQTADRIYNRDFNEIAQSPVYILNSLISETAIANDGSGQNYTDLMFLESL